MTLLSSLRLIPGTLVLFETRECKITDLLNHEQVVLELPDGARKAVNASDVSPLLGKASATVSKLDGVESRAWAQALETYEIIQPLVQLGAGNRKLHDVQRVAESSGIGRATIYRWLSKYEATGLVSSLLRGTRKDKGSTRLSLEVEAVITSTIESFYLSEQRRSPTKTWQEVRKICKQQQMPVPDERTVRRRINEISDEYKLRRRRGSKAADERFLPLRGNFPNANYPLAVVQIDHTPMDVIVVDDVHRKPIDRPYLTIAIDVFSKMVVGFYISLDPPGALATGMCLSNAILGKDAYLSKLGIEFLTWPVWGVMRTIHSDNAKEFRGTMLGMAAAEHGIIIERRPKGQPRYGGHVERTFRTHMHEIHNELPGTTFSNVAAKMEYDAEGKAVMTLDALEKWFALFVLGVFHQKPHEGNGGYPPIVQWQRGISGADGQLGTGIPPRVPDSINAAIVLLSSSHDSRSGNTQCPTDDHVIKVINHRR